MTTSSLRVSVIIPAYRAAATIRRALDSVLAQTRPVDEVLVIDDGSGDNLAEVIADYPELVRLIVKENGGAASARNRGLDQAIGDLIAFLDADDFWHEQKNEQQVALYEHHPELGLTCGLFKDLQPDGSDVEYTEQTKIVLPLDEALTLQGKQAFQMATYAWTGTVMVRREVLGEHRFVSGFEPAEDRHLWYRLIREAPTYFSSECWATAIYEPGSLSRGNIDKDNTNFLRVVHEFRDELGSKYVKELERDIHRKWAGCHLFEGRPHQAFKPAWGRLRRDPFSLEAWWAITKSGVLSVPHWFSNHKPAPLQRQTVEA